MTQAQVDEAYQAYASLLAKCKEADNAYTEAQAKAYSLKAELELCERRRDRAWQHYERCLRANQPAGSTN